MPYQDTDDEAAAPVSRHPTLFERGARKILLEDWGLKLLAAAVTVVLWMAVTGQNQPVRQRTTVQLHFIRPDGIEISNDVPSSVEVMLRGSHSRLSSVGPTLVATVDLTNQKSGERVVRLQEKAQLQLPPDVSIEAFRPATLALKLEPIVETTAEVEVKFDGTLPEGYEVKDVSVNPPRVTLRGPSDRVTAVKRVVTESVSLDGRTASFVTPNVAVIVGDARIEVVDITVSVHIEIVESKKADPLSHHGRNSLIALATSFMRLVDNTNLK